jgi:hypothetical protein
MNDTLIIEPQLAQLVHNSAEAAVRRFSEHDLVPFRDQLCQIKGDEIRTKANAVRSAGWHGAFPTWEPPDAIYSLPEETLPVIGVDGSQIYPDLNLPVQWAYLQTLAYTDGKDNLTQSDYIDLEGLAAGCIQRFDLPEDLLPYGRDLKAKIDYQRTLLEVKSAVRAANNYLGRIVLLDMPLVVWPPSYGTKSQNQLALNKFYSLLNRMAGYPIAGVVSSPSSSYLHQMISLTNQKDQVNFKRCTFQDRFFLMDILQPGERTALFEIGGVGNDMASAHQALIYFFYLRINDYELVRVEIPAWAAKNKLMIAQIHASIYQDSLALGYSHALSMAHHLVTIPEKKAFELKQIASDLFFEHPNGSCLSAKMRMKLGWERG